MKYPFVQQNSEEDCGAACLAMVTKYHGRTFSITRIREAVGTGQLGTTLLGLRRGASGLGLHARSGKADSTVLDQLDQLPLPAILHWKGVHWVVLYGRRRGRYVVADPALGIRYLKKDRVAQAWGNGAMLLLIPDDEAFYAQESDRPAGLTRFLKRAVQFHSIRLNVWNFGGEDIVGILFLDGIAISDCLPDMIKLLEVSYIMSFGMLFSFRDVTALTRNL